MVSALTATADTSRAVRYQAARLGN